jgi:phosphoglycolate phosphatase-like HAD superfamily hydrolase
LAGYQDLREKCFNAIFGLGCYYHETIKIVDYYLMHKSRYNAILLDVDDTLFKTRAIKWQQHKWVAKNYYDIKLSDKTLGAHWGKPFDDLVSSLYDGKDTPEARRANFIRHELDFPKDYQPHALELINNLHISNIVLGLISSMYLEGAMIEYKKLKLPFNHFAIIQGTEATNYHKPDGRVFIPALNKLSELGVHDGIAYVGDALSDFKAATDAGLEFIAVTQGLASREQFLRAGAKYVFSNLKKIECFILKTMA